MANKINVKELKKMEDAIQNWISMGWEVDEIVEWVEAGIDDPELAGEWNARDYEINEAIEWVEAGIVDAEQADVWKDWGFDIFENFDEIKNYVKKRFTPKEAAEDLGME